MFSTMADEKIKIEILDAIVFQSIWFEIDMFSTLIDTITKPKDNKAETNAGKQGFFIFILI